MKKIRLWVLVMVTLGILTSCDSCDDGMDYPIVKYAAGVTPDGGDWPQKLEEIRLGFKTSHPDIKIIEVIASGTPGRTGDTIKISKTYITNWDLNLGETSIKARVDQVYNNIITQAREAPRIAGEAPRLNGEASRLNGEATRFNGEAPRLNGEAPRFNGEATRFNGEASRLSGEAPRIRPYGV
jgi:hypothetical protein